VPARTVKIQPEEYILSALSKEDRLDAALALAGEAFKDTELTMKDVESAVKAIRKKINGKKK